MPTLIIRHLDAATKARLKAHARRQSTPAHKVGESEAGAELIRIALDHLEARRSGAHALNASRTPAERSAAGRHAVAVREAKRRAARE